MPASVVAVQPAEVSSSVLVDRRRPGELFPSIPLAAVELSQEEAAAVLMSVAHRIPTLATDDTLTKALTAAVGDLGPVGAAALVADLRGRSLWDRAAMTGSAFATRLSVLHWYEGARTRRMNDCEAAAALYLSPLRVQKTGQLGAVELSGFLAEGIAAAGADAIVALGACLRQELGLPYGSVPAERQGPDYVRLMPSARRRRFAYRAARADLDFHADLPMIARLTDGRHAVGTTVPQDPADLARLADLHKTLSEVAR